MIFPLLDHNTFQPADLEVGSLKLSFQLSISEFRRQTTYMAFCFPFLPLYQMPEDELEAKHSSEIEEKNLGSDDDTGLAIDSRTYFHRYQKGFFLKSHC